MRERKPPAGDRLLIVYDGACGFCSTVVRVLRLLDWRHRLSGRPFQNQATLDALDIPREQAKHSVFAVGPNGTKEKGAAAVAWTLDALLPWEPRLFRTLQQIPGVRTATEWLYNLITRYRHRIPAGQASLHRERRR